MQHLKSQTRPHILTWNLLPPAMGWLWPSSGNTDTHSCGCCAKGLSRREELGGQAGGGPAYTPTPEALSTMH